MSWIARQPLPIAREGHTATAVNDIIYVIGGQDASVLAYDSLTDTWSSRNNIPTSSTSSNASDQINGVIYVAVQGMYPYAYNPATNTWSVGAMRTDLGPVVESTADAVSGRLYVIGGADPINYSATNANAAYNPQTDTWQSRASAPNAIHGHAGGVINGVIYICGGANLYGGQTYTATRAYNPSTNTWATRASMPQHRRSHAGDAFFGRLHVVGGLQFDGYFAASHYIYNPETNTWSTGPVLPATRAYHATAVVGAYFHAIAGRDGTTYTSTTTNYAYSSIIKGSDFTVIQLSEQHSLTIRSDEGITISATEIVSFFERHVDADASLSLADLGRVLLPGDDSITVAAFESWSIFEYVRSDDTASLSIDDTNATTTIGSVDDTPVTLTETFSIAAYLQGDDTAALTIEDTSIHYYYSGDTTALNVDEEANIIPISGDAVAASIAETYSPPIIIATDAIAITGEESQTITSYRTELGALRIDVAPATGGPFAPVFPIISADYKWVLGELGEFSAKVPTTAVNAVALDSGKMARIVRDGEGIIFAGFITQHRVLLENDGPVIEIRGYGLARELSLTTTKIHWIVDAQPIGTAVNNLLLSGWSADVEDPNDLVTAIFEGATRFDAISQLAVRRLLHVRPEATEKKLTLFRTTTTSPYRLVLYPHIPLEPEPFVLPIQKVRITRRDEELINRVIPLGAGEGINTLDLRWSDRTSPYPIQTLPGPNNSLIYYLEDTASSSTYGVRERVIVFKNVAPIANSPAAYREAANVLYDLAVAWLRDHKDPVQEWEVEVLGPLRCFDPVTNTWLLRPGQWIHVTARGVVEDVDGKRIIVDIDDNAFVRGIERSFSKDSESVKLQLSTTDTVLRGDDALAEVVERLWALAVHEKHITFLQQFGPLRQSIAQNYPVMMRIVFDNNVRFLHQVKIRWVCRPLRSNVATAAAGGGQTSSAGTPHTHTISATTTRSGGGTTSSAGTAHSHSVTVSGQTAQLSGAHSHKIANYFGTEPWADPPYRRDLFIRIELAGGLDELLRVGATEQRGFQTLEDNPATEHGHPITAAGTTTSSEEEHTHTIPAHAHDIDAQTSSAESSHTHTIYNHTHPLIYGIYETTLPSVKQVRLLINNTDVTNQLGGPWDQSEVELDITQFLQTMFLTPVQQSNTIELRASALFDIEVSVRAIITISSVVPLP